MTGAAAALAPTAGPAAKGEVVLALENGQREPRVGLHVAESDRSADCGEPECLRIDGEQRRSGMRAAVGPADLGASVFVSA